MFSVIAIALLIILFVAIYREIKDAPTYGDDPFKIVKLELALKENEKPYINIDTMRKAGFTQVRIDLPQQVSLIVPIDSVIKIDGYLLMLDQNKPDYIVIRQGVKETAPCVPYINIHRGVITFE